MPRKTQFKVLDKSGTRFPTIREARLREQWRVNSQRYYAKKKLERALNPNGGSATFEREVLMKYLVNPDPNMNKSRDELKAELEKSIKWFYGLDGLVSDVEKEDNDTNLRNLNIILEAERIEREMNKNG